MRMKVSRSVSGLGIGVAVICSVVSMAFAADTKCSLSWTDCDGLGHSVTWTCDADEQCCTTKLMRHLEGGGSCIVSVIKRCKRTSVEECDEVTWEPEPVPG